MVLLCVQYYKTFIVNFAAQLRPDTFRTSLLPVLPNYYCFSSQIQLDILCNGVPLGNEISFSFVKRLLWHGESDLHLSYRLASDAY